MLLNLKVFLSLLIALGLVACNGDEKKDEDKVTLKFADLKDFAKGASPADFSVKVHKGDKVDEESKLKVKVEIACGDDTGSKESTAAKGVANFSASDFSGITWPELAVNAKCNATATGEGAEKATKEFKVTAVTPETEETATPKTPAFPAAGVSDGMQFSITNGKGAKISLVDADDGSWCNDDDNYFFRVADPVDEITKEHTIGEATHEFFVVGSDCELKIEGVTDTQEVTAVTSGNPGIETIVRNVGTGGSNDKVGVTLSAVTGTAPTAAQLFVKAGTGGGSAWEKVTISNTHDWSNATQVVTEVTADTGTDTNRVLLNIGNKWSYDKG